ncbi:MAG: DUF4870 domain-containing protein [Bacteroidota bacterium]|nr:DUF4870 domain-containing protein [Bacteroidota bacterium]
MEENNHVEIPKHIRDERMFAMLCHLSVFSGFVIPFGNIIVPLIIWKMKKYEFPLVDDQGKEVLNFQISMLIYIAISVVLTIFIIGIPILIALLIFDLIITVIGALKANEGIMYRYPMSMHILN